MSHKEWKNKLRHGACTAEEAKIRPSPWEKMIKTWASGVADGNALSLHFNLFVHR